MDNEFHWEEHNIIVDCRPSIKYLWLATETIVKVDDVEIGRVGGFKFKEKISGEFISGNQPSQLLLEIKVDLKTLATVPYSLLIDGNLISHGRLKIYNWWLILISIFTLISCTFCSLQIYLYQLFRNNPPG